MKSTALAVLSLCALPSLAVAGTTWHPAQGTFGTLLFEDQWPCAGDRDFNDRVLRYNTALQDRASGNDRLTVTLNLQAAGAQTCVCWGAASGLDGSSTALDTTGNLPVATADLDLDGDRDVILGSYRDDDQIYQQTSLICWNTGTDFDTTSPTGLTTHGVWDIEVADLDDNGWPDLVFANSRSDAGTYERTSFVYWNGSSGFDTPPRSCPPSERSTSTSPTSTRTATSTWCSPTRSTTPATAPSTPGSTGARPGRPSRSTPT